MKKSVWRKKMRYGIRYVLCLKMFFRKSISYRKNIQSPAATSCRILGIFCHQIQNRRDWPHTWWLPGDSFLFRQIYKTGKSMLSVVEKWKQHYRNFYQIYSVLRLPQPNYFQLKSYRNLPTESQKVRGRAKKFTRIRQSYSCLSY